MEVPPRPQRAQTPPRRAVPTLPQGPPTSPANAAHHDDPLGLGLSRNSRAPRPVPEPVPQPEPEPESAESRGGRAPPPLDSLKKAPPPLHSLKKAKREIVESKYAAARTAEAGELKVEEVKAFLVAEGIDVDNAYVQDCMQQFDGDANGTLSLDEFSVLVASVVPAMLGEESHLDGSKSEPMWDDLKAKAGLFADKHAQKFPVSAEMWKGMSEGKKRAVMAGVACWCLALVVFLISVASVVMEEECVEEPPVTACSDPFAIDFSTDVAPAVDILFIADRSQSMAQFEGSNAQNYFQFISSLASNTSALGDRWHLIVANSADGCHTNEGGYLSVDTPSPGAIPAFERAILQWSGDLFPHTEALMTVAKRAVEEAVRPGGCNPDFLRRDALLHVILVSDSHTAYDSTLDYLVQVKDNDPALVKVSVFRSHEHISPPYSGTATAITATDLDLDPAELATLNAANEPGFGFKQAASETDGVDGDVASSNWRHACYMRDGTGLVPAATDCTQGYDVNNVICTAARENTAECPQVAPTVGSCVPFVEGAVAAPPPAPTDGVCALNLNGDGGDEGYDSTPLAAGQGGFSLDMTFTSYNQRDQLVICRGACPTDLHECDGVMDTAGNTNCVVHNSGCVGVRNQNSYTNFPVQTTDLEVEVQVLPNCVGGRGTAWTLQGVCTAAPPPPPPTPVFSPAMPTCDIEHGGTTTDGPYVPMCNADRTWGPSGLIVRDGAESVTAVTTEVCYRDIVEELSVDKKVFGHYRVPKLPSYRNYTNLRLHVGSMYMPGPRVLPGGASNPACAQAGVCKWSLENSMHQPGEAAIEFDTEPTQTPCRLSSCSLQEQLAVQFNDGQEVIRLSWDEFKTGGCVTTTPPPCPDGPNPLLFILFIIVLILICVATYKSVVRKNSVTPPATHMLSVKDYSGEVHEVEITEEMSVSDVKSLLEKVSGVPLEEIRLFNEAFSQNQLEGQMLCSECGLIGAEGASLGAGATGAAGGAGGAGVLTMMVSWTIYVREDNISESVAEKMRELGVEMAAKIHTVEGVEKHWKVESVKLRLEQMCGVPAQDQLLHVVTQEGNRPLQDGTKLPDYFPDVRNRCELVMVDSVPDRDVKKAKQGEAGGKKSMGADSVLSMARMFQAGHVPGSSLSDLQEDSLLMKKQAYYGAFFGTNRSRSGAKLAATTEANLMARAGRAKGMHRP